MDDDKQGIRGDELADDASGEGSAPAPAGGVRGSELAEGGEAGKDGGAPVGEDGIRGDGLAEEG